MRCHASSLRQQRGLPAPAVRSASAARRTVVAAAASGAVSAAGAVLVTGCSTGIGRVTAEVLVSKGFTVFAGVRSDKAARELAAVGARPVKLDVTSDASVQGALREVQAFLGPGGSLLGVVNNAGKGTFAPLELMSMEVFKDTLEVNLLGVLRVTKAFLPLLKVGPKPGRIVMIGSYAGTVALPLFGPYNVSKFGLEALSDVLRYELDHAGVKTVLIKPGGVKTPIWDKSIGASEELQSSLPANVTAEYASLYKQVFAAARSAEKNGVEAREVADTIVTALTVPSPRSRYLIGDEAKVEMLARRILPDWLWDRVLLASLRKNV